jgi:serine protease Do
MQTESHRLFSLAAVVVAAVLFGMVLAGALNITPSSGAEKAVEAEPVSESPGPLPAAPAPDFAALADRVVPSVVSVFNTDIAEPDERRQRMPRDPFHFFFGPRDDGDDEPVVRQVSGSGFFISSDGELITNNHVVEHADKIEIELADGLRYEVEVVGTDPETDVALLKVSEPDRDFPVLALGDSDAARVGEWVMAVGNPLDMQHTVTVGVVSATGRVIGLSQDRSFENFIQTDAAINVGNSGGPLVNLRGEVIGINTAINVRGQNLGFAVPIATAKRILDQLRDSGSVVRGYLGVMVRNIDQRMAEAFGLDSRDGAFVDDVLEGHAADKGGLTPGDVVVEVNGRRISDTRELIDMVSAMAPGTEVELEVVRDGRRRTLEVVLEERQTEGEDAAADDGGDSSSSAERVGISVSELDPRLRQYYRVPDALDGVVITHVRRLSPAGEEGLREGDIITEANGVSVGSPEELVEAISRVEEGGYLRLYVHRPRADQSFFAILQLGE